MIERNRQTKELNVTNFKVGFGLVDHYMLSPIACKQFPAESLRFTPKVDEKVRYMQPVAKQVVIRARTQTACLLWLSVQRGEEFD